MGLGKKLLAIGGGVLAAVVTILLTSKDKNEDFSYSSNWLSNATDDELKTERERVRREYCSSGNNFEKASELQNTLYRFDAEMSKRAWGDEEPKPPSYHREHGWYLPNDD